MSAMTGRLSEEEEEELEPESPRQALKRDPHLRSLQLRKWIKGIESTRKLSIIPPRAIVE